MIQDNVSGMLKGVRGVLKQLQCLEGDAVLVQSHAGIGKMRKSLLGDFHVFVKASKMLQELHQSQTDTLEDRQFVLVKGCKVVMRAIRFLDMWNAILDEQLDLDEDGDVQMPNDAETPASVPTTLPSSVQTQEEYPFPKALNDQSSVHPAFRTPNARRSVSQQLPPKNFHAPSPTKVTPTRGATTQLGGLRIGGKANKRVVFEEPRQQQHQKTISRDLPGLISAPSLAASQSGARTNTAGTQRSYRIADQPAKWSQRESSLPARGRTASEIRRQSITNEIKADINVIIEEEATPVARAQTTETSAEVDPTQIDGRANQSNDTTPTRTQQQATRRRASVPLAPISQNVKCLPPTSVVSVVAATERKSSAAIFVDAATDAGEHLASHKLTAAHDAFLGLLGLYIAGHLKRRSTMDLYRTTYETSASCQTLLNVVLEIWQRDGQQSSAVDEAAQVMRSQFAELYDVTSEILKSSAEATNDADAVLAIPNHDDALTAAATNCARSAGDTVLKTRAILARLGDFGLDSSRIGRSSTTDAQSAIGQSHNLICASDDAPHLQSSSTSTTQSTSSSSSFSPSSPPKSLSPPKSSAALPPQHALPPPPPAHQQQQQQQQIPARVTTPLPTILSPESTSCQSTPTPTSSARHDSQEQGKMPSPICTNLGLSPALDVSIPPPLSPIDIPEERSSFSSINSKATRADSLGASVTNSTSTRVSSFRHSAGSIVSTVSTRATTPDKPLRREVHERAFNDSFNTLTSESTSLSPEDEEHVEHLLAAETHVSELVTASDGSVTGGTLQALVEKLTPYDIHPDSVYLNAFYLTFRLFTTPTEFAQTLIDRFNSFAIHSSKHVIPARLRVYNIFKGWIDNHWQAETDCQALPLISEFAHGPLQLWLSSPSKRLIEVVDRLQYAQSQAPQHRAISGMRRPNTASSDQDLAQLPIPQISKAQLTSLRKAQDGGAPCNVLNFDTLEIARHLTIIDSRLFCAVEPEELLSQQWLDKTSSKGNNVRAMSSLTNDIINFVADTILQFEEPKKRALAIKQWISIARHCQELGNYNAMFGIVGSLATSMIHRLEKTWSFVSPKTMAVLQELQEIVDHRKNYGEYRKRIQAQSTPCIPFIGIHLTDLTFVDVGNDSIRQVRYSSVASGLDFSRNPSARPVSLSASNSSGGIHHNNLVAEGEQILSVINFDKYAKTSRMIGDLLRFQKPYRLQPVPELMEWIEKQLARVRGSKEELLVKYDRRSKQLEPRKVAESRERLNKEILGNNEESIEETAAVLFGTNGSGRGRLQWLGKMNEKFTSHRGRSDS